MAEPTWREPLHREGKVGRRKADETDAVELDRAEKEKEKRQKEAEAEGLDMLGDGRDRKDMLQKWAQRLRGKATAWQNVLIENGEAQPGLEERIKGCRGEEVPQAVSKARYHLRARAEAVEDKCRPECTLARCLCRLDVPQEPKGRYHGIRVRQQGDKGPCGCRWGKMKGRRWCTSTKSSTCGWDMRMVGAEQWGRMRRRVRGKQRRRCSSRGRWSQSRRCCGCRCSGMRW